jgi:hypothetical protein
MPLGIFNEVFQIEELDKTLQILNTKYNICFQNEFSSSHHRIKTDSVFFAADIPYKNLTEIPQYKCFYDLKICAQVEMIFNKDIQLLPYSFIDLYR